ncbi:hypothetical protein CXG81DRAFT_21105 [Caulochytrium protostelioides]|uniref:NCA2-domain-containing protein n=1 Tax=Caulochytrium protostelioides TaxID=1555241 RepID=A0A4P9X1E2_9FUNG|nr:hypothetical protein CXG81DRAFT_21105 [Caulochytrium protostelioides]|eukprot:RKO98713.1 hypothetical protein CXG81DRAFT_21105 [Caulochytrium protostelioides]
MSSYVSTRLARELAFLDEQLLRRDAAPSLTSSGLSTFSLPESPSPPQRVVAQAETDAAADPETETDADAAASSAESLSLPPQPPRPRTPEAVQAFAQTLQHALASETLNPFGLTGAASVSATTTGQRSPGGAHRADVRLPPIADIEALLHRLHAANAACLTDPPASAPRASTGSSSPPSSPSSPPLSDQLVAAHDLCVAKAAAVLQAHLLNDLFRASSTATEALAYWSEKDASRGALLAHWLVQSLPQRLARYARQWWRSVRTRQPALRPSMRYLTMPRRAHLTGVGLQHVMRAWTLIDVVRDEIRYKVDRLKHVKLVLAGSLGMVTYDMAHLIEAAPDAAPRGANAHGSLRGRAAAPAAPAAPEAEATPAALAAARTLRRHAWQHIHTGTAALDSLGAAAAASDLAPVVRALTAWQGGLVTGDAGAAAANGTRAQGVDVGAAVDVGAPPSMADVRAQAMRMAGALRQLDRTVGRVMRDVTVPSPWLRYWPAMVAGVVGAVVAVPSAGLLIAGAREVSSDLAATLYNFFIDWIYEPALRMYETVRHRDSQLGITGAESLRSDLQSLERMVLHFAEDSGVAGVAGNGAALATLRDQVSQGDMTVVMQAYESELRHPVRNLVAGHLVRTLLIQIQKAKVDVDLTLAALDKLLKSNELNFGMLALVPAATLAYGAVRGARALVSRAQGHVQRTQHLRARIRQSLREIDRQLVTAPAMIVSGGLLPTGARGAQPLTVGSSSDGRAAPTPLAQEHVALEANVPSLDVVQTGLLLVELQILRDGRSLLARADPALGRCWLEDLQDLECLASRKAKRLVLERIWRTYPILS